MTKRDWLFAAGAAFAFALAGGAAAQEEEPIEMPSFEDVDTNENGVVSESEAAMVPGLDFADADLNGDGVLSRTEYQEATEM
jgi:hypothetical protein